MSPFASPSRAPPLAAVGLVAVTAERSGSRGTLGAAPSTPVKIVPRVRSWQWLSSLNLVFSSSLWCAVRACLLLTTNA